MKAEDFLEYCIEEAEGFGLIRVEEKNARKKKNAVIRGQRRNSVAELSEDDRQTVHEEWQI